MQTFLPYTDYARCAAILDSKRLQNQRNEAWIIHQSLTTPNYGWQHHPAVLMWQNHEYQLVDYALAICAECDRRGIKDTEGKRQAFETLHREYLRPVPDEIGFDLRRPWWMGVRQFHDSHMSALLRKDPVHYHVFSYVVPDNLPYWWPTHFLRDKKLNLTQREVA